MGGANRFAEVENAVQKRLWYWLLLVPFAATLFPPLYARGGPSLFGFPFFYWYQILWIIISAAIVWVVFRATKEPE